MMMKTFFLTLLSLSYLSAAPILDIFEEPDSEVVLATKKIAFDRFPESYNPSLTALEEGFLLSFRYRPDPMNQSWLSEIWVVVLNDSLEPVTEPQQLNTRPKKSKTPSQAEDARFFHFKGRLFLIYNDNIDEIFFDASKRRDLFIAEVFSANGQFQLSSPLKLFCEEKYYQSWQQKNWIPFEWQNDLYFIYSMQPHEVLSSNLKNGHCFSLHKTALNFPWKYGSLRGSSEAQLIDGEYWAFFHSGMKARSPASHDWKLWHYFMGVYTFSAEPPFAVQTLTPKPIMSEEFYTPSYREKRVIFPGGFAVKGPHIYVAYGKDDCEIWIATLDKEKLKKTMVRVNHD